jgi:hypothetical protein
MKMSNIGVNTDDLQRSYAMSLGVLRVTRFLADKKSGLFDMQDVLGLR